MAEYSRLAKGHFTSNGGTNLIELPFQPDYVELLNFSVANTALAQHAVPQAWWDVQMGQGTAIEQVYTASATVFDTVATNGISTFSAGMLLQYGPQKQVIGSTKGTTTSFNVSAHGFVTGDVVIFEGLYETQFSTGMPQMCGMPFVVTYVDANDFTVNWNSNNSSYTNLSGSPIGAFVRKVLYPFLYEPGVAFISALTLASTTTVVTTAPHNFETGQQIAFRIPSVWGPTQLNSLPDTLIPGQSIYGYVQSITDNQTFVCNINSTGYTAFTTAQSVTSVPGLTFPQVLAVGDVNSGGIPYSGGVLYPPPSFPTSTSRVNTINGPAIRGAFVNNTFQGFSVGPGAGTTDTASALSGASGNVFYYRALLHDISA